MKLSANNSKNALLEGVVKLNLKEVPKKQYKGRARKRDGVYVKLTPQATSNEEELWIVECLDSLQYLTGHLNHPPEIPILLHPTKEKP